MWSLALSDELYTFDLTVTTGLGVSLDVNRSEGLELDLSTLVAWTLEATQTLGVTEEL